MSAGTVTEHDDALVAPLGGVISAASSPVPLRLLIGGEWLMGDGAPLASRNPARPDEVVAEGTQAVVADVNRAMRAARAAAREWSRTPIHERGAVLARAAAALEARAGQLGLELAREEGKTLAEGTGEVMRAAQILRYYAAEGDRSAGEHFASPRRGERILVTRKPLGVVGIVTPFNFPIAIPAWKIAPALVYGNAVVWKPASTVPLLAMRLAEALADALAEAGLPAGVLNLIIGPGALGTELVRHPDLDGLSFTGSTGVGRMLAGEAASRGVPFQGEMGGKNAAIVLADADLDLAAEQVLFGAFRSTGQKCTATSRLIVVEEIADAFLAKLAARLDAWRVGNPSDPAVHMGPLVTAAAAAGVRDAVATAEREGARVAYRGQAPEAATHDGGAAPSAFVPATILEIPGEAAGVGDAASSTDSAGAPDTAAAPANIAWREELFGPVLAVRRAASTEEAFALAEDSEFGLTAALFTRDIATALDAVDTLDVGILHVNSESAGADPHVPFGGAKKSGYGPKEQGGAAKEFFTHTTTVYLRG
ncbi:aldehyde dehydrogenase family protein [Sinomonas sp. ASV486]|uniref:aldehyde dehydrogenase family protein n=1 Tax=Sinomonas sp. ASV486 TaxID=3051170 RepID=UPI0027DDA4FB|nr:aldehyde dehydrogenase family protein [Sinomonas sp. ASV486]MDQ4489141.1 aldehyde dehydrogenase family protein [Sinomonas sp. ASV486]